MKEKVFVNNAYKNMMLENFFKRRLARAGFSSLKIIKTPVATKIVLYVAKPGLAIGYSGSNIKRMTAMLEKEFSIKNPLLEIKPIENPQYDAQHIVNNIVSFLNRNYSWRSVVYRTINDLQNANLLGFELIIKGKLIAKGGRKQKYRVVHGYMKKVGDQVSNVNEGRGTAYTRSGAIGVTLRIIPPDVMFPDKIGKKEISESIESINEESSESVKE